MPVARSVLVIVSAIGIFLVPGQAFGQYAYRAMFPKAESLSSYPLPRVHPPINPKNLQNPFPQPVDRDHAGYPAYNVPPWALSPERYNLDRYPPVEPSPELVHQPRYPLIEWMKRFHQTPSAPTRPWLAHP